VGKMRMESMNNCRNNSSAAAKLDPNKDRTQNMGNRWESTCLRAEQGLAYKAFLDDFWQQIVHASVPYTLGIRKHRA
jgi:hypothetical protein